MKPSLLFLLLCSFSIAAISQKPLKNAAKIGAFIGSANLCYERVIGKRFSLAVTPAIGVFSSNGIRYSIGGGGLEFRYYLPVLKRNAPMGFYLSPGAGVYSGNASVQFTNGVRTKTPINGTAIKATAGYQHVFKNNFVLDVSGGTQYLKLKFKGGGGLFINDEAFTGYVPYVGVGVGYAF